MKIRTYWKCCWFLLGTKEDWVIAPTASLHLLTFQNMEQNVFPEIDLQINIIFCTGVASGIQNPHIHTRNGFPLLVWPLIASNLNPERHYSRHLRWWKPAQLSLTSLHPLQGSQPTNKRVGCNHQATKIDVCFGSCQRNKSSHENSDILEMLLVSFRYERRLSHSPNSKPASIDVSKHGAKRISRNRSTNKYHFLYWCCIRHPKSTHTHSQWIPLTGLAFNRFEFESGASLLEASALVETGATVTDVSASTAGLSTYKQESRVQPPGHENWRLFWFQIQIIARTTYLKDYQGQRNDKSSHETSDVLEMKFMLFLGACLPAIKIWFLVWPAVPFRGNRKYHCSAQHPHRWMLLKVSLTALHLQGSWPTWCAMSAISIFLFECHITRWNLLGKGQFNHRNPPKRAYFGKLQSKPSKLSKLSKLEIFANSLEPARTSAVGIAAAAGAHGSRAGAAGLPAALGFALGTAAASASNALMTKPRDPG